MTPRAIIGVDLGGTHVRSGRVEGQNIISHASKAISAKAAAQVVIDEICGTIDAVFLRNDTAGIGIGVPSLVDTEKGIVYTVENIPSWKEVHLKEILEERYRVPVHVNNDANCFALGEFHFGKGRGLRHMVGLIVGTGLGAGIIVNGRLYSGANCGAGEIGAIPYREKTIEGYVSGTGLKNIYGASGEDLCERAGRKDAQALEIFSSFGKDFGHAVQTVLYAFDPELIVLGGSVSKAFRFYESAMKEQLKSFAYPHALARLKIQVSEEPRIALLGAAALCLDAAAPKVC
ncbi:MAG: ROK family protein [Elusimicrobiota bacterium]|jgi:glucokinase